MASIMEEENIYGEVGVLNMGSKTTNSKYTEDWLPVKNIANGMIELDNKFKVTGVKVRPRNIFILDSNLRNNIISQLRILYDTLDFEFWFISADRPVDISDYMATNINCLFLMQVHTTTNIMSCLSKTIQSMDSMVHRIL
jgi:phosphopantetheine adenylyltransferase